MNVSIIGTGYVGLSAAVGFGLKGHKVTCVDVDEEKVKKINDGECPIYEPGMESSLKKLVKDDVLSATTDFKRAVKKSSISFICVGTPSDGKGRIDLRYVRSASSMLGDALREKNTFHVVVVKSTVVPGTTEGVVKPIVEKRSGKKSKRDFGVAMNPEFLREGRALEDFLMPDRIIVGYEDEKTKKIIKRLYSDFKAPVLFTSIKAAEMIKYASNAFLATKISFINEVGNICKRIGIDTYEVADGMGLDKRIERKFLDSGVGFGGSCFPKDVSALACFGEEVGVNPLILRSVLRVNKNQRRNIVELLAKRAGNLRKKTVAILGLAFKPNSDDIREAPSIDVVRQLLKLGARVRAYDPKAMENFRKLFRNIYYASDAKDALKGAHACLILTDWDEFKKLTSKDFNVMKKKIVIEGRRTLDKRKVGRFEGICW